MKAYLMPYSKRFDDAFRITAMKGRFPEQKLSSWLSTAIADKEIWDFHQGLVQLEDCVRLELAEAKGAAALRALSLQTLRPKKKARSSYGQVLCLVTFT